MTSLAYNIGLGWEGKTKPPGAKNGFRQSSVLKAHNRGDTLAASRAFRLWNRANNKEEPGLTARRAEEAALYLMDEAPETEDLSPQAVEPESRMTESPINRAGVVAGGTAAVATVAETARTVADVKYSTQALGDWLVPVLLIVVVALCGYTIWQRVNQRKQGWA
jgi:lysozyme